MKNWIHVRSEGDGKYPNMPKLINIICLYIVDFVGKPNNIMFFLEKRVVIPHIPQHTQTSDEQFPFVAYSTTLRCSLGGSCAVQGVRVHCAGVAWHFFRCVNVNAYV